jgi:hypothetical protein
MWPGQKQLLAQRISQDPLYMKHLKEFNVLTQNMADGTPQVKRYFRADPIHKYLAVEKGYTAPSSLRTLF